MMILKKTQVARLGGGKSLWKKLCATHSHSSIVILTEGKDVERRAQKVKFPEQGTCSRVPLWLLGTTFDVLQGRRLQEQIQDLNAQWC